MNASARLVPAAVLTALLAARAHAAGAPVELKSTEIGAGPAIVLVHDFGGGRMVWMPVAKKLMGHFHVVMVDLPGHGDSPMPDPFSLQAAADALDAVVAKQKDGAVIVGHGVGGVVALLEASAHPAHAKGVVVVNAAAKSPMDVPDQQRKQFEEYLAEHYEDFVKMLYRGAARDSNQAKALQAQAMLVPAANMKLYLRELLYLDASGPAKNLKVPLLYVGSGKEWPADMDWPGMAKKFGYDEVATASGVRLASAGNFLYLDQPDSLAAAVADFANKAAAGK